jgi:hypothetical protein
VQCKCGSSNIAHTTFQLTPDNSEQHREQNTNGRNTRPQQPPRQHEASAQQHCCSPDWDDPVAGNGLQNPSGAEHRTQRSGKRCHANTGYNQQRVAVPPAHRSLLQQ